MWNHILTSVFSMTGYPWMRWYSGIETTRRTNNAFWKVASTMYVCMVTHIARVWFNRVRLPILRVVS